MPLGTSSPAPGPPSPPLPLSHGGGGDFCLTEPPPHYPNPTPPGGVEILGLFSIPILNTGGVTDPLPPHPPGFLPPAPRDADFALYNALCVLGGAPPGGGGESHTQGFSPQSVPPEPSDTEPTGVWTPKKRELGSPNRIRIRWKGLEWGRRSGPPDPDTTDSPQPTALSQEPRQSSVSKYF